MSGFWAGAVPPWAYVVGACLWMGALLIGAWYGYGRGERAADAEEERLLREQAKARRTHPVYRHPPEFAHEPLRFGLADDWPGEPPELHEWHDHPPLKYGDEAVAGCPSCERRWETDTVLNPTAVLTPQDMTWTGEIQRMTADFERDMERILGGTDEQLREITR